MERFEYEITKHMADTFYDVVFFCSEAGECTLDRVPLEQEQMLTDLLNERGEHGWGLVQISFGKDGFLAFWKRKLEVA